VQAAAKNEMAFEQRTGIAEDFQDIILSHRANVKSKAQSSKQKW
jgi:hypothetical protein